MMLAAPPTAAIRASPFIHSHSLHSPSPFTPPSPTPIRLGAAASGCHLTHYLNRACPSSGSILTTTATAAASTSTIITTTVTVFVYYFFFDYPRSLPSPPDPNLSSSPLLRLFKH
nr:hypothetical protein CFP56_09887 [Quercus suber]